LAKGVIMWHFWGSIDLQSGKWTALVSKKDPRKNLSVEYKDWRRLTKRASDGATRLPKKVSSKKLSV
jgi:hypothetical protein